MQRWAIILACFAACVLFARPGDVDESFKPRLPADYIITAVCEQKDGKLLVAGLTPPEKWDYEAFLIRLKLDGKIDSSFRVHWRNLTTFDAASQICARPDGRIGVLGWHNLYRLRLFSDSGEFWGETAESLHGAALLRSHGRFDKRYALEEGVSSGSFFPDGSILYPSSTNYWFTLAGIYAQLRRLDPNGNVIWTSEAIAPPSPVKDKSTSFAWCRALPDGTMVGGLVNVVETWYRPRQPVQDYRNTRYYFYSSAWGQTQINISSGGPIDAGKASGVAAPGPTNSLYLGGGPHLSILTRRLAGWQIDPSFNFQSPDPNATIRAMAVQPDGKIVYCFVSDTTNRLYRCNSDGSHYSTFSFGEQADASVQNLLVLRSGKILAWGSFTDADGVRRQTFVRLNTD